MNHVSTISDEFLNALVDDQLAAPERDEILQALNGDAALRERLCELRGLKQLVQHAYPQPPGSAGLRDGFRKAWWPQSLAACFALLMVGGMAGWLAHGWRTPISEGQMMGALQALQHNDFDAKPVNYVVHVDTANPVRLKTALDETESLLSNKKAGEKVQVEIVANGPGLNLLREGASPYAQRIAELQSKYPNLALMACGQTIRKLKKAGVNVELLPHTKITPSALEQIISLRLKQHWVYIKV